jgi:diguanylate cyclase (GGDEF) domain
MLAFVQIAVAILAVWAAYATRSQYRESLEQHAGADRYRRQLESISSRLQRALLFPADQSGYERTVLLEAARDSARVAADWRASHANFQKSSNQILQEPENEAIEVTAGEVAEAAGISRGSAAEHEELARAGKRLLSAIQVAVRRTDAIDEQTLESSESQVQDRWVEIFEAITFLFTFAALFYIARAERAIRLQVATREASERELLRERETLEKRVGIRTAELEAEVKERRRAELLNQRRSRVLEMLVRNEPAQKILDVLIETAAMHSSTWACALHLMEDDSLVLKAQSRLPNTLKSRIEVIALETVDAPELGAMAEDRVYILPDLSQVHKPWVELLRANGTQSVWSAPFSVGGKPIGTITIYSLLLCPPRDQDIDVLKMSCQMATLILERRQMNEELIHRAYHDSLTGVGNRRFGKQGLGGAIQRSRTSRMGVGVLWIDLDKFKKINDTYGHSAGDAVLQEIANRLSARLRKGDTLARMGGDEFMVVLEGIEGRAVAEFIASDLHRLISEPISTHGTQFNITASFGIAFYPEDGDTADALELCADTAMYEAKFNGLGVRSFNPMLSEMLSERRTLELELARALDREGFSLLYQPQCMASGKVVAFEALLRFNHPELGSVPPSRFIPVAEEMKLILPLGRWIMKEVCRQLRRWQDNGYQIVPVAVNISALQFARDDFADEVAEILATYGISPSLLELELTEGLVMKNFAESARQMRRLKDLGVRIAIDDFGTGYSSLSYLHRLPIDVLKIDRSFVELINETNGTWPIVEAVISMAQALGLQVVGEGVETVAQMETLQKGGCEILQGYLFSRPVPAEDAARQLAGLSFKARPARLSSDSKVATMRRSAIS